MLPRMPIAAGTNTRRPGSCSRVWVMAPSVSPASRSPPDETSRAARPWPTDAASDPRMARTRAPRERVGTRMTTRRLRSTRLHRRHPTGEVFENSALSNGADATRQLVILVGDGARCVGPRPQGDGVPSDIDVGVVIEGLGHVSHPVDERHGLLEVLLLHHRFELSVDLFPCHRLP